ncbi:MAG: hypothetical protein ABIN24_09715 [Dyadobacter sp.]
MKSTLIILLLFISSITFGQIRFIDELNWEKLSKMAQAENKLVFIHLENNRCDQCNEVASMAFGSKLMKDKFDKNFISVRTKIESVEGKTLASIFGIRSTPVSLFVSNDGNILSRYNGSNSNPEEYLILADIALERKDKKKLSEYEQEYLAGEKSIPFLKAFIISRAEAGMSSDELLEQYVSGLTKEALNDLKNLEFIYSKGPSIDSPVYKTLQTVSKNSPIDILYNRLPLEKSQQVSDAIVENSMRKAISGKDEKLAMQTAVFSKKIFQDDPFSGNMAYHRNIIRYYRNTSNKTRYVQETEKFIDSLHMHVTIDSLAAFDKRVLNRLYALKKSQTVDKPVSVRRSFSAPSQFIIRDLNENAWHFYEIITNKDDLESALQWSNKSIELAEASYALNLKKSKNAQNNPPLGDSNMLDTNARLLYKLGRKQQAIEMQNKAIQSQKRMGMPSASFEKALAQMMAGTL